MSFSGTAGIEYLNTKYVIKITASDGWKNVSSTFTIDFYHKEPEINTTLPSI